MKFLTLPDFFLISTLLTACNQNQAPLNTTTPDNIDTSKQAVTANSTLPTYTALTNVSYPPFEFRAEDGTVMGMEIEIFNAIAKDQGFNVQYVPHAWDGIFDSLNTSKPEFVVSAVTMTDEAKEQTLLSDSYYFSPYRAVSFDQHKLDVWHTLKIGISSGEDSSEDLSALNEKPENLISYDTVFVALSGLIRDEVDVVVADSTVLLYNMNGEAVQQYKDKLFSKIIHEPEIDGSKLVFAIDKAHPDLQKKVNDGL